MKFPSLLPERALCFLRRRQSEELAKAKRAECSEDRIGHLALARAFARQIDRQTPAGEPAGEDLPGGPIEDPKDQR